MSKKGGKLVGREIEEIVPLIKGKPADVACKILGGWRNSKKK